MVGCSRVFKVDEYLFIKCFIIKRNIILVILFSRIDEVKVEFDIFNDVLISNCRFLCSILFFFDVFLII